MIKELIRPAYAVSFYRFFRDVVRNHRLLIDLILFWRKLIETFQFWIITGLFFALGVIIFRKLKPHFADVL